MTFSDKNRVLDIDAQARLTIYMINHANSPLIAQLGDFSHDAFRGGFISGDGLLAVSWDGSCVQALLCSQEAVSAPSQTSLPIPALQSHDCIPTVFEQRFCSITPSDMMLLLSEKTGQHDFISLCRNLGLDKVDFDKINEGIFIRAFKENKKTNLPYDWIKLPIIAHDNSFIRLNVIVNGDLFELKCFKYVDRRGIYGFCFKPEHSGVWFRDGLPEPGITIIIDTRIMDVLNRISPANAGLIDVGDISAIDWNHFFGHEVQYVWRHDTFQCKNDFSKALHFLAEAKKNGIDVSVLKYSASAQTSEILDLPATIKQARCYGLDIPAVLKDTGYVHVSTPQEEFIPDDIPFFWSRGGSTLFFSPGYRAMLKKLLTVFCRKPQDAQATVTPLPNPEKAAMRSGIFPRKQVGILYPTTAEARTNKLLGKNVLSIPCISAEILQKEDALETVLYQHKIEALFILYADELPVKDLTAVLELCERLRIVTGVFSPVAAEDEPAPEDVLKGTTMELVAQYYFVTADGDSVIAKDMITEITERYTFEKDGKVTVSEVKKNETEKDEEN
jgi:hypothetical protein